MTARSDSWSIPSFFATPGRNPSTKASASRTSRRMISWPSGEDRSTEMHSLASEVLIAPISAGPYASRIGSPLPLSILMTRAPSDAARDSPNGIA